MNMLTHVPAIKVPMVSIKWNQLRNFKSKTKNAFFMEIKAVSYLTVRTVNLRKLSV